MLLILLSLAHAEEPTPEQMYRNGTTTATVGAAAGLTGFGVWTIGAVANEPLVASIASLPAGAGAPFLAGGSLRARRGVEDLGVPASDLLGTLSWACWASSLGAGFVAVAVNETELTDPITLVSNGLLLTSYGMGIGQNAVNRNAYTHALAKRTPEARLAARPSAPVRPQIGAAPFVAGRQAGLVLTGSF